MRGRGGGRGRGRGAGPTGPSVRLAGVDAETEAASQVVHVMTESPPLYPGLANLPTPLPISAKDRRLIAKASMMRRRSESSAYNVKAQKVLVGAQALDEVDEPEAEPTRPACFAGAVFFPPELAGTFYKKNQSAASAVQALELAMKKAKAAADGEDAEADDSDKDGSGAGDEAAGEAEEEFDADDYTGTYYYDDADDDGGAFREDDDGGFI